MSSEGIHRPLRVLVAGIGPHSERTRVMSILSNRQPGRRG